MKKGTKAILIIAAVTAAAMAAFLILRRSRKVEVKDRYRSDRTNNPWPIDLYQRTDIMYSGRSISDGSVRWVKLDATADPVTEGDAANGITYVKIRAIGQADTSGKVSRRKLDAWIEQDVLNQ